jgi:hypothetical protein
MVTGIMLNVILLCCDGECNYADCHYGDCPYTDWHYGERHFDICHYGDWHMLNVKFV